MTSLLRAFGPGLTAFFVGAVVLWAVLLIIAPQFAMLDRALTAPKRTLDSSVAASLSQDAETCISVLRTFADADAAAAAAPPAPSGGMSVPSMGGMAVPSMGGMAVPSMGSGRQTATAVRPYILQCDRADTHRAMVRSSSVSVQGVTEYLDELHGLPRLAVKDSDPIAQQNAMARQIADLADDLANRLRAAEAQRSSLTLQNFEALFAAASLPQSAERKAEEDSRLANRVQTAMGLRFQEDGVTRARIGLIVLTRTVFYAMMVTALALVICYPIAYKVALASTRDQAIWLFLGLVIPYAIVELMRVYAWTTILDNNGLVNSALMWVGAITDPIQFKRMPGTVFLVVVYTYVLFMVFPIYNVMSTLDRNQIEAATDLGARPWRMHWRVVIPHAKPGIAVGCIATFMLAAGAFSVPRIVSSGLQAEWFAQTIYNKFFESENSNIGAAYSFAYTALCFTIVALFMRLMRTRLKDFARVQI
jgi:spermidine/putrescine transport system permease protein